MHPLSARLREAAGEHAECCIGLRKCIHGLAILAADALDAYHEAEQRAESPEHEKQVRADLLSLARDLREIDEEEGVGVCEVAEAHIGMLRRMLTDARAAIPEGCESVECETCKGAGRYLVTFSGLDSRGQTQDLTPDCPDCSGTGKRLRKKES